MKRIAILTLSIGSGHVRASSVVARALEEGNAGVDVRALDAIKYAQPWFRWFYVYPYWWMLRYARGLWGWLYERRHHRNHRATAPRWVFRWGCRKVLRELRSFAPHLLVVTEIGAAEIAALGKREGWVSAPLLAVQTDFQTEPPWVQPEIDFYCVGSEEARSQLIGWGISPHRILVVGIPIDPVFALPHDKPEILRLLGLAAERPVVLVMAGGMGPAPLDEVVLSLGRCGLPLQVIAVAGHDAKMRARLESLRGKVALDLRTLGWIENVPELMAAADLLVTKPGGLSTSEALAAGLPMVLTHPIPGPEEHHARHLVQQGVALHARTSEELPQIVLPLLRSTEKRAEMARRARELARPDAAYAVAQVGRALLERATYIDLLASPGVRANDSAYVM
jgi:processive 1,2-diacylglycerol beta-glucosyltransferase